MYHFVFDLKINDEVHHLTTSQISTSESNRTYTNMLAIKAGKQLSLTATLKVLEPDTDEASETIISNDNIRFFGDIIDRKALLWAITNNIVCDYLVQTIITNDDQLAALFVNLSIVDDIDKRLFLAAYVALKSINDDNSHHLLVYANCRENAEKIIDYAKMLMGLEYFTILRMRKRGGDDLQNGILESQESLPLKKLKNSARNISLISTLIRRKFHFQQ